MNTSMRPLSARERALVVKALALSMLLTAAVITIETVTFAHLDVVSKSMVS